MSIEIVIPVRNMPDQVGPCVASLVPQLGERDRVTVVDDASTDDTAAVAGAAGARVVRMSDGRGPYVARHAAARASDADALLFVDARCRALPGLVERHRRLLAEDGTALSCTNVEVVRGPTLAGKVAAAQQMFRIDAVTGIPGRLDYYPTANLGVRREAYEAVGGFRELRSGGDADLCWRIQLAGLGRLRADPQVLMFWEPRRSLRDLASQWYRYGVGAALLEELYPIEKAQPTAQRAMARLSALGRLAKVVRQRPGDLPATAVAASMHLVFLAGYRRARRHVGETEHPRPVGEVELR